LTTLESSESHAKGNSLSH